MSEEDRSTALLVVLLLAYEKQRAFATTRTIRDAPIIPPKLINPTIKHESPPSPLSHSVALLRFAPICRTKE